jgi:chorismate-pyruvate lyase
MRTSTFPSLPLRMLLATDGSVTALLEAGFDAPLRVRTAANHVDDRLPTPFELELDPGRPVLWRHAVLEVAGRPVLRASSVIALDRLGEDARAALLAGREPIGRLLRGVEARRELLLGIADEAGAADAQALDVEEGEAIFERTTRIVSARRPLAIVTERIPASIFDSLS